MSDTTKVDMLATARNAQWSADTFLGVGSIKLVAPAKVNLFLGVGERRDDGYHDVSNIMHAVALHDVLYVRCAPLSEKGAEDMRTLRETDAPHSAHKAIGGPKQNLLVSIDCADKVAAPGAEPLAVAACDNIVFKAFDQLACEIGRTNPEEIAIRIEKNIPHEGGLGGGSSDAAAALVAAAHFWGLSAEDEPVRKVARNLGADVLFFLHGGCVRLVSAGDAFDGALEPMSGPVVLVKPAVGVSTAAAYRAFDETPALMLADQLASVASAKSASEVVLANNLAAASESLASELVEVRSWLSSQTGVLSVGGVPQVLLCGSGAATFAMTESFAAACEIAAAAQARGWWARATTFSSLRAAKLPSR